jgi:hypothetical protein
MLSREQLRAVRKIQIRTSHLVSDLFAGQYQSVFGRGTSSPRWLYHPATTSARSTERDRAIGTPHVGAAEERELR